jgi:hypothetical protein
MMPPADNGTAVVMSYVDELGSLEWPAAAELTPVPEAHKIFMLVDAGPTNRAAEAINPQRHVPATKPELTRLEANRTRPAKAQVSGKGQQLAKIPPETTLTAGIVDPFR